MTTPERQLDEYIVKVSEHTDVRRSVPLPIGTHESEGGVNFALFSRHATHVRLDLFERSADATPVRALHQAGIEVILDASLIHEDVQSAVYLMFNASSDAVDFSLPPLLTGAHWYLAVDTLCEAPQDMFAAGEEPVLKNTQTYCVHPRSSVILLVRESVSVVVN